jgi:glutathione-regulated potassium-efflux system protein KefB
MDISAILLSIVVMLAATALCVILFQRLGFGAILGFIVAGVLIGPHTPGPVPVQAQTLMGLCFLAVGISIDVGALLVDWDTLLIQVPILLVLKLAVLGGLALAFGIGRSAAIRKRGQIGRANRDSAAWQGRVF